MKRHWLEPSAHGITEGVIWQQLLIFFLPILLGTFFQQLYNTADAMIVGQYVGKEALAAVGGTTGNLINLIVGFFVGLASGATVILSQYYGARNDRDARRTVHTAMAMALAGGALLMVLGLSLSPMMLRWMNTPEEVMEASLTYIRIYFIGMIPSLIYNIGAGLLRAVGDSRRPLYFLAAACLTNIALDLLFVMKLGMGVAGAAWATIISQAVSAVLVVAVLTRSTESYRLTIRNIRFHGDLTKRIMRIGLPAGLQSVMYSISNVLIQTFINGFGTDTTAAWSAWGKLDGFHWMILNAFGISVTTFVGQNFGAGKIDRVKKGVRDCMVMSLAAGVICSGILLLFGRSLFQLFAGDEKVLDRGMEILRIIAPWYCAYTAIEILSGALRGMGNTFLPTMFTLSGICVFRLLWLLCFVSQRRDLYLTVISYPITWILTSLMFIIYWFIWRKKGLTASMNTL